MGDRFQYAEVRQKLINALRTDLMGPQSPDEVLDENPMLPISWVCCILRQLLLQMESM